MWREKEGGHHMPKPFCSLPWNMTSVLLLMSYNNLSVNLGLFLVLYVLLHPHSLLSHVISSLPAIDNWVAWMSLKTCISTSDKLLICDEIIFLVEKAYLKIVYKEFRDGMVTSPTAQINFNAYFVYDTYAKKNYSSPYRVALDTKTREFQCKVLNRCLVTNAFLCKIGIIPSPACSLCGESENPSSILLSVLSLF